MTSQLVKKETRSRGTIKGQETKAWKKLMKEFNKVNFITQAIMNEEDFKRSCMAGEEEILFYEMIKEEEAKNPCGIVNIQREENYKRYCIGGNEYRSFMDIWDLELIARIQGDEAFRTIDDYNNKFYVMLRQTQKYETIDDEILREIYKENNLILRMGRLLWNKMTEDDQGYIDMYNECRSGDIRRLRKKHNRQI